MPKVILALSLRFSAVLLLFVNLTACTGSGLSQSSLLLSDTQRNALLAGDFLDSPPSLRVKPAILPPSRDIIAVDPHMRQFLDDKIDRSRNAYYRLNTLIGAVINNGTFGLDYEGRTRTSVETFHLRNGNCLAFTNMFIALARDIGLDARFQEVDTPPFWERIGDTMVVSRHMNVLVKKIRDPDTNVRVILGNKLISDRVIDFNLADFRSFYPRRVISDERAFAQYYSNLGVDQLQAKNDAMALAYFRRALELDPAFAPSWVNVGVLYSRAGKLAEAEAAYRQSLAIEESMATRHNLAILLQATGNHAEADTLRAEVEAYRHANPYYRYQLGLLALEQNNLERAQTHFEYALDAVPQEHRFNLAMGIVMLRQAHTDAAKNFIEKARNLAEEPQIRDRYNSKLKMLVTENGSY